jgi:predicted RNA-binding Zn-ribbon protein involved in translation (DUF1610 family)
MTMDITKAAAALGGKEKGKTTKPKCPYCRKGFDYAEATRDADRNAHCPHCGKMVIWTQSMWPKAGKVEWVKP